MPTTLGEISVLLLNAGFDPSQPRAEDGEWTSTGGGSGHRGHQSIKGRRGGSAPKDPRKAHIISHMLSRGVSLKSSDIDAIDSGRVEAPEGYHEIAKSAPPLLETRTHITPFSSGSSSYVPPRVMSEGELARRLAYAKRHEDPRVRIRAKSAEALLKSSDEDLRAIGRRRVAELPKQTQEQQAEVAKQAANPLSGAPERKEGESFANHALRAAIYAIESADKLGRASRGALSGKWRETGNLIPFSDYLGITKASDAVSGRDLLEKWNLVGPNTEGFDWGDLAGFGAEILTDPLTWASLGAGAAASASVKSTRGITKAAQAAAKSARVAARAKGLSKHAVRKAGEVAFSKKVTALKAAATRSKPLVAKVPGSIAAKGKKLIDEGLAAQTAQYIRTGGSQGNPAAAALTLFHELSKSAAGSQIISEVRKKVQSRLGKAMKVARETKVPTRVSVLGKTVKTGLKRPTTVGTITKRAQKATLGHPSVEEGIRKARVVAGYLNKAHLTGKAVLEAAGKNKEDIPKLKEELEEKEQIAHNRLHALLNPTLKTTLVANFSGNLRRERWNGKNYLVAPLSLIVEGVLNGSKGPLHYPLTEMKKSAPLWNNTPIVVYHPTDRSGRPLRAKGNSDVLNRSGIGVVRNAVIRHPKLVAEGWFDEEKTKKVDPRVYNALVKGQKMELSTGLDTDNEPATNGSAWNGRSYTHIAKNYRPDHLAILPDQQGACSISDGCGVGVANAANCCKNTAHKCDKCRQEEVTNLKTWHRVAGGAIGGGLAGAAEGAAFGSFLGPVGTAAGAAGGAIAGTASGALGGYAIPKITRGLGKLTSGPKKPRIKKPRVRNPRMPSPNAGPKPPAMNSVTSTVNDLLKIAHERMGQLAEV